MDCHGLRPRNDPHPVTAYMEERQRRGSPHGHNALSLRCLRHTNVGLHARGMIAASPGVSGASWTEKYPMNLIWVMPA